LFKAGISALQGGHHVAQKFKSTTFPLKEERAIFLPVISFRIKSGALELMMLSALRGDIFPPEVFSGELGPIAIRRKRQMMKVIFFM
jgi:hypothetical protein